MSDSERILEILAHRIAAEHWVQNGLGLDEANAEAAFGPIESDDPMDGARRIIADLEQAGFEITRN